MMKTVVTGVAGFIGSHLCEKLLATGHEVVGLDNFDPFYDEAVKRDNISLSLDHERFELVEGDICDATTVEALFQSDDVGTIVHLAAKAGVRPSIEDPLGYQETNVHGTMVLLEAARKFKIEKFIFASSSSVYGNNKKVPFAETDNVDFPISPYAATKKAGELLCHTYHHLFGTHVTCLRFFTVYGPRQRPDLAIHKFARLILADEPIPVFGDGSMQRDFTYIDDIVQGIVAAMSHCQGYEIYNLGESSPVRLDVLIEELEKALGQKARINGLSDQPGDVRQTYADVRKAKEELDYLPTTQIDKGLAKFVLWLNQQPNK